jgi:superoxide dismutase
MRGGKSWSEERFDVHKAGGKSQQRYPETVEVHHGKHHQTYVNNLNKAIEGLDLKEQTIEELLRDLSQVPEERRQAVINHGGGHYNHLVYWETMTPGGAKEPQGELAKAIDDVFGSFEKFKEAFEKAGAGQFGSGWAWLAMDKGELKIVESRFTGQQGYDASSRERCLGARLLPEIPEQTRRLSERMVGSRQLGRRRNTLREGEITLELIFLPEGGNLLLPPCSLGEVRDVSIFGG